MILFNLFLLYISLSIKYSKQNFIKAKVWGPGLEPQNVILPARYIFLETFQSNNNLNKSDIRINFKVSGKTLDKTRICRIWSNVLNRKDGSFVLRYKLYEPCRDLQIDIKYNDEHVAESPYKIDQVVYNENCYCPKHNIEAWLSKTQCGELPEQIKNDLKPFAKINWNQIRNKLTKDFNTPGAISLCHYVIKENKIYRRCYGKHVGFKMFMDNILLSLLRKIKFPDMEFFVNLGDWPLVSKKLAKYPVFSWCGSTDTYDIVMPTYDIAESSLENMGRVMLDMLSVQGNTDYEWENRIPKAFWRGRDSNQHRLDLIDISKQHADLFNASITNFFFYRDKIDRYGPGSKHVSFYKFFDYKYQISIDGTVAAYRFPYLAAGGSLIFKQSSKYYEHFYNDLVPNKHYIPIKKDLSDLVTKLKWAIDHDGDAKIIADNAKRFANDNLLPKDIYCYHAFLFNEFYKLVENDIDVLEEMEEVEQPEDVKNCDCANILVKEEL